MNGLRNAVAHCCVSARMCQPCEILLTITVCLRNYDEDIFGFIHYIFFFHFGLSSLHHNKIYGELHLCLRQNILSYLWVGFFFFSLSVYFFQELVNRFFFPIFSIQLFGLLKLSTPTTGRIEMFKTAARSIHKTIFSFHA